MIPAVSTWPCSRRASSFLGVVFMAPTSDPGLRSKPAFVPAFANQDMFSATDAAGRKSGFLPVAKLPAQHRDRQSAGVLSDETVDRVEVRDL